MKQYLKQPKILIFSAILAISIGLVTYRVVFADSGHDEEGGAEPQTTAAQVTSVPVEVATDGNVGSLGATSHSWSGEILSTADVAIHPSREGQIAEWYVRLGDKVRQGQLIGRLTPPPASPELASLLGEQTKALVLARAQADATRELVVKSKQQLLTLKESLLRSRDTALTVAEKEALQNIQSSQGAAQEVIAVNTNRQAVVVSAEAEMKQAEALIPLKRQTARVAIERLSQGVTGEITREGRAPQYPEHVYSMNILTAYGTLNNSTLEFTNILQNLLRALQDPNAVPEKEANSFMAVAQKLLSGSIVTADVDAEKISEVRSLFHEDQTRVLEALREYKEAEVNLEVKKAELIKIKAEGDREFISAQTSANNARVLMESAESIKQNKIAETDTEFARDQNELDAKIAELDRELALANAEVRGAQAAYSAVAGGAAGQNIVAARAGIVSAIYKNPGDHVSPDVAIAGIGSPDAKGKFVRFHIPSDMRLPVVGEEVQVERPGFPLDKKKAKIVGVGLALDENGSYAADAEFIEPITWPVHASVRVITPQAQGATFIPFSAIWWNDAGVSHIWLVMENDNIRPQEVKVGRAVGDKVEVEEGLQVGDRYVSRTNDTLQTGQSIVGAAVASTPTTEQEEPAGDGHGHSHDE